MIPPTLTNMNSEVNTSVSTDFQSHFAPVRGYLSAATAGLPTLETVRAMRSHIDEWQSGALDATLISDQVEQCRDHFATIAGVNRDQVGIGSQVSQLVSIVAASLPPGSDVLCAAGDFASLVHPFVQRHDLSVRYAPLEGLADAVTAGTRLIAFSLVQSATGQVADHRAISEAAVDVGARTLVDLTQSIGWLNVGASHFDYTVCHSYKWLCSPRGMAFLTITGSPDELNPLAAGWCSADDVWESCYSDHMPISMSVGRYDLSPVWPSVGGTEAALRLFARLDREVVQRHSISLANAARELLDLESSNSAIVTWADPLGEDLKAMKRAGIVAAGRAGNARISFHLWNTPEDVMLLRAALNR